MGSGVVRMYYKPKYFKPYELVDRKTYELFGDDSLMFFNFISLQMLDDLRDFLGVPLIINNWKSGGSYEFSGFRPKWCDVGGEYSQHRLGQAFDIKPVKMSISDAFIKIINNMADVRLQDIAAIEDVQYTPTWLHVDCRHLIEDGIRIVKP